MKAQELTSDRPGSTFDSSGDGRHGMEPPDLHHHHQEVFAKEIADYLEKGRNSGKFVSWHWSHRRHSSVSCDRK
jgi:hypothetical protein